MVLDDLGVFTKDENIGWYYSEEMNLPLLDNMKIKFILDMYDDYIEYKQSYIEAMHNMLKANSNILKEAEGEIFNYYKDMKELNIENGTWKEIKKRKDIWEHIKWCNEPMVTYREDDSISYVSFECRCDWEIEHGLQIVFKDGKAINKIGSYDGHLTNSDAFARPEFENKVYISRKDLGF